MIGIFRNFIKGKLTDDVGMCAISHQPMRFQFHRSILEELGPTRQHLTNECDAVVRLHRLNLHIDIHIPCAEEQLARWGTDAAYTGKHGLIKRIEDKRRNVLGQAASFGSNDRLKQIDTPLKQFGRRLRSEEHTSEL